ncbi:hypothetical protein GVK21_14760 [Listeria monocytogenes]|uniref:hypothetical protein n=1 Tax=Listeria monocytogenes TaxID=1639 RepID=UPI0010CF7A8D|nr:hypothetical protein [Listeria monocytogenes]EDN8924328.1 hypothetical protein [Listeria monocytogenes]
MRKICSFVYQMYVIEKTKKKMLYFAVNGKRENEIITKFYFIDVKTKKVKAETRILLTHIDPIRQEEFVEVEGKAIYASMYFKPEEVVSFSV